MTLREAGKKGVPNEMFGILVMAETVEHKIQGEMWSIDDLMANPDYDMLDDDIEEYHFYDCDGVKIR